MKALTKYLALFFALGVAGSATKVLAQTSNQWVEFSSSTEYFRVSMPHLPREETLKNLKTNYGDLDLTGKRYEASLDGATYAVWALTNTGDSTQQRKDPDRYLDACAQLIWDGLLKPARDKLPVDRRARTAMVYTKELSTKTLPGREYSVTIGDVTGTTQFFVAESRLYVLLAMNFVGAEWTRERFFESFTISPEVPGRFPSGEVNTGPGTNTTSSLASNQPIFRSVEVTKRVRILDKVEPVYTDDARKFQIQGTVVLRAVFSATGEVTNISVIRKLPHGLTQRAVEAARGIRFIPAEKDGHPVSMWMQLEYNFNLY